MLASQKKNSSKNSRKLQQQRATASNNTRVVSTGKRGLAQQRNGGPAVSLAAIQKKVNVGPANDTYEQEADSVASQVVSGQKASAITPLSATSGTANGGEAQRQAEQDKDVIQPCLIQLQEDEDGLVQSKFIQAQSDEQAEDTVQAFSLQRQADESVQLQSIQAQSIQRQQDNEQDTEVQARLIQREQDSEQENIQQKSQNQKSQTSASRFESNLTVNPTGGVSLAEPTRNMMESGFNADFSNVRIHNDSQSVEMNQTIGARAFTYGNHIYFNRGEYSPGTSTGSHLLAHELTHTVQQGAVPGKFAGKASSVAAGPKAAQRVQRSWLGNAWGTVSGAVNAAAGWVGDSVSGAIDYIKDQALDFVQAIPGYRLLTVVLGEDPISGNVVPRNGRNFITAGLDIIPNGADLERKLREEGALTEAAEWLDGEIAALDGVSATAIGGKLRRFWNGLGISDVSRIGEVLQELAGIFMRPVQSVVRFAENVAKKLLQIIKNYVISSLIDFIRERTNTYPLLTVILGRDPISDEPVERTPMALFRGFMQLSESGAEQLRQMEESGSLQRAVDWLDGAIDRVDISWELIRSSFSAAWDLVTIQNLLNPRGFFTELYNIFSAPAGRIVNFIIKISVKVLSFIKDALISRLIDYARTIRGYPLLTVLLGKDPFSEEPVERNAENIVHGFMSLMENGEQQFQEMQQSGAIERLNARVENAIDTLNFTWEYIRGLFLSAWSRFSLQDLAAPVQAFISLLEIFGEPLLRLINFIGEIIRIVIEVIMEVMNFPIDLIRNIISRAMQAIDDITRDPIGFLKNLIRAVKTGFEQFFSNIATHLLNGLTGWLFSELRDANISPPVDFSFSSILGFVLEVLGITVERIWEKLAERIGQERVDRIRGMIDRLTGIWTFVKDVMTRGPVAIWEYIQERLSSLWDTVLSSIRNWVMTRIVERIVARLITMLDPTGIMTVVNGFIAFYDAVQSFIRYIREMLEIVNSFVVGVAELARGNVSIAANFLENSLAQAMPVAIGFLAQQVGLAGIGRRIGEMIENVRGMVDEGLTWLVDRAVSAGTAFLNTVRNALGLGGGTAAAEEDENNGENDWRDEEGTFQEDGEQHEVTFNGSTIIVASGDPVSIQELLRRREREQPPLTDVERANVMNVINVLLPELNAFKNEYDTALMDNDSVVMASKETAIASKLQEVANILAGVNMFQLPVPSMVVTPGFSSSIATDTEAKFIYNTPGNHSRGTSTSSYNGDLRGAMTAITNMGIRQNQWVRFHLINSRLGGQAVDSNLVPAPASFNSSYESVFENPMKRFYDEKEKPLWFNISVSHWASSATIPPFLRSLTIRGGKMKVENNQWVPDRGITPWQETGIDKPVSPNPDIGIKLKDHIFTGRAGSDGEVASRYGLATRTVRLLRINKVNINSITDIRSAINEAGDPVKNTSQDTMVKSSVWTAARIESHITQLDNSVSSSVITNNNLK